MNRSHLDIAHLFKTHTVGISTKPIWLPFGNHVGLFLTSDRISKSPNSDVGTAVSYCGRSSDAISAIQAQALQKYLHTSEVQVERPANSVSRCTQSLARFFSEECVSEILKNCTADTLTL